MSVDPLSGSLLSLRETAERLGVHENTVRNWVASGILQSARAPGARIHRFDATEVERVRMARTPRPEMAQTRRRIVGPELADATRLSAWADLQEARTVFPRLVRRLLAATPGVEDLEGRADEGVAIAGWDLRAKVTSATSFLPAGALGFELGVGRSPAGKAQRDYDNRSTGPSDVAREDTVFVFATPRRWAGSAKWAADRRSEKIWRDVRVLDGDRIEGWLESTPSVHYWISEQIGLNPRDVLTADQWWRQFSGRTRPALPPALLMAGREAARTELLKYLDGPPVVTGVKALWSDDAVGFVCVALGADDDAAAPPRPALIVESAKAWRSLVIEPGAMTLIPLFPDPDVAAATAADKQVVVPFGADGVQAGKVIALPRPSRPNARDALAALDGLDFDTADRLAALARRSMPALIRRRSANPRFAKPAWGDPPASEVFAPLLLVGAWTESEADRAIVSELTAMPWPEVERTLRAAAATDDPPFVQSGGDWRVASHEEAFDVLGKSLTTDDLQRWTTLTPRVLLERDPSAGMEPADRLAASLKGELPVRASSTLRRGLAESLALVASHEAEPLPGDVTCADRARTVVRDILDYADADTSGETWQLLSYELPLIAEAAPELFLERVHLGSSGSSPPLAAMFGDGGPRSMWGMSSPHTGLLWALEVLCWSPDWMLEATHALAQLDAIDPGGQLSNRPSSSLSTVLVPWIRHTSASLDVRLAAVDQIVRDFPDSGWTLLTNLWPSNHMAIIPPSSPRFRDWTPDDRHVPITEWVAVVNHVIDTAISAAGHDASRWAEIVDHLAALPADIRDRLIEALDRTADEIAREPEAQLALWESLTKAAAHHRAFATAAWAMGDAALADLERIAMRIEPAENVERFARLFDWRPDIPGGTLATYDERQDTLQNMRMQAVRETLARASLDGLGRLAERVPVPTHLGWSLGLATGDDYRDTLLVWLSADGKKSEVARWWVRQRAITEGTPWTAALLADIGDDDDLRLVVALESPSGRELWELLADISTDLADRYWAQVSPMTIPSEATALAVAELLKRNRPWDAITALAAHLHRPRDEQPALDASLAVQVLEAAATTTGPTEMRSNSLGYEIGSLLDYLTAQGTDETIVARLEFAYFPVLRFQREARTFYRALSADPELFVDLVSRVYRAKTAPNTTSGPKAAATATHAWHVLGEWRTVPGLREDHTIDADYLRDWVERARLLLSDRDRADVGDEQIGQLLSGSPEGADGAWPAEPIRDLVEQLGSREIEHGIQIGKINSRGMTSRGIYDGGDQERDLANRFREWSTATAGKWRRTSRLLREIAESYERDAMREDMRAQAGADAG